MQIMKKVSHWLSFHFGIGEQGESSRQSMEEIHRRTTHIIEQIIDHEDLSDICLLRLVEMYRHFFEYCSQTTEC